MQKPQYNRPTFERKTPAQQQQEALQRAIATAKAEGLAVIGSGRMIDGRPFWLVPSTTDSFEHHTIVQNSEKRLQCNCTAGLYGRICKHRAACFLYLQAQAEAAKKQEAPQAQPKAAAVATVATPAQPRTRAEAFGVPAVKNPASALYDDSRSYAGSIFKPEREEYVPRDYASHQYR